MSIYRNTAIARNVAAVFLSIALVLSFCPGTAYASTLEAAGLNTQEEASTVVIVVGGNRFTCKSTDTETRVIAPGVEYSPSANTLVLVDAQVTSSSSSGIIVNPPEGKTFNVLLYGDNRFTTQAGKWATAIMVTDEPVRVYGSGSMSCDTGGLFECRALTVESGTYRSTNCYRGIFDVAKSLTVGKDASIYVTPKDYTKHDAIKAKTMTNEPSSLKQFKGALPRGARIAHAGSVYRVTDTYEVKGKYLGDELMLESWGGGTTAKTKVFSMNGLKYATTGIATGAFNNAKGKKVKKMYLEAPLETIEANAFKGTTALTYLSLSKKLDDVLYVYAEHTGYRNGVPTDTCTFNKSMNKKAFAGMGKSSGKKLVVHCNCAKSKAKTAPAYFKAGMMKKGLSKKVSVKR